MKKLSEILILIRPHYWSKNLLIFIPYFANKNENVEIFSKLFVGLLIFSLVSSIGYVFNDIIDLENDKKHIYKKNRPLAQNLITVQNAKVLILILLLICAFALYFFSNIYFSSIILVYLIGTLAYTIILKKIYLLDITVISFLFLLRIEAGSAIIEVDTSFWLLSYSLMFFLSLSFLKRLAEIINFNNSKNKSFVRSNYATLKTNHLYILSSISNLSACVILYFYISSNKVIELYENNMLLYLTIPLLAVWYISLLIKIINNKINIDPIIYTLKDKFSYFILILIILIVFISS